jgi:predicted nucleotidyltransferase component of viral defense system
VPLSESYQRQVELLIAVMPFVAAETAFALKGGTAINLFIRDLPRLSVDIDLTYLPVQGRAESLVAIDEAIKRIAAAIAVGVPRVKVAEVVNRREGIVTKIAVQNPAAQIKIEVTPVLRGCVFAPEMRGVSARTEDRFGFARMQVVSFADLYAGKIVAALDRQHPRDLFDVGQLLAKEGIDDNLRAAFIVYLISHDRPIAEVITPRRKDITAEFLQSFDGMTEQPVTADALAAAREALIADIAGRMPDAHKTFLLGFKRGTPDWGLLNLTGAADLPAVRWKQLNLNKLPSAERERLVAVLAERLELLG